MKSELVNKVFESIKQKNPGKAYEHCFNELVSHPEDEDIDFCLGLLSMIVGNDEVAEWYLNKCKSFSKHLEQPNISLEVLKYINNPYFEQKWDSYRKIQTQQELRRMAEIASQCYGDVLEIGCGSGDLSIFIACHGSQLYGIDIEAVAIDLARHKTAKLGIDTCHFQLGNAYGLDFKSNLFDTIVIGDVLKQVDDPKKVIIEAYRVCKPGGTIIISVPNGYSLPTSTTNNIFTKKILNNLVEFSIGQSLQWSHRISEEWIMGTLIKPFEKYEETSIYEIKSYFLPQPYSLPKSHQLVTVIIPTYNRKEYIAETVQSVLHQTHKNIEIIVVDDGSLESPKDELFPYLDHIKYVYKENGGKSSALNEAIHYANGEFIWVFDDDDIALPLKLELQLKRFVANPDLGMVHSRSVDFNDINGQVIRVHDLSPINNKLDFRLLMRGCFVHGPTVIFRKSCLDQLGGWDPQLVRAQDYDFWLRMALVFEMEYLPVPTVRYRVHTGHRGSANEPVTFNELVSKTAKYEQVIFKKLYQNVPINEMYKEIFQSDNVTLMLEAFIERALVYAARGLLEEAKQDLVIAKNNAFGFGNPCFSMEAIQNIHKLGQAAVQGNWSDQELVSSIHGLVQLITSKE
ncbi:glycosyltransferase [Paenibacillus phocaensis]|uniref:glycosyltransferase n=1 Tax=Paenibacillus phocaensis TaxID=1776378 RepID=UPI000839B6F7|nr:glycosyltransferase [Paenibacillus phocaensis]